MTDLSDRFEADAPLVVTPVVDGDTYGAHIALRITPDRVRDLARAVEPIRDMLARIYADGTNPDPSMVDNVASHIFVTGLCKVAVSPDQLDELLEEVEEASDEPEWCDDCGERYALVLQCGVWRCDPCQQAADETADQADGRRWAG